MLKILVCGGRDFLDYARMKETLDSLHEMDGVIEIIQGGAKGADFLAKVWAAEREVASTEFPANWEKFGRAAGHVRNSQMLLEGKPDLVIAFDGGKGTQNMVMQAEMASVKVLKA